MISEPKDIVARHDPAAWVQALPRRDRANLPFDPAIVATRDRIVLDANVYIRAFKAPGLPEHIQALVIRNFICHSTVAASELATSIGHLNPTHADTASHRQPIIDAIARMKASQMLAPSPDAWLEASVISGICARTRQYQAPDRKRLLFDALIFLSAIEADAVLVSENIRDMDLLLRFRPNGRVLLYDRPGAVTTS